MTSSPWPPVPWRPWPHGSPAPSSSGVGTNSPPSPTPSNGASPVTRSSRSSAATPGSASPASSRRSPTPPVAAARSCSRAAASHSAMAEGLPFAPIVEALRRLPELILGRPDRGRRRHRRAAHDRDRGPWTAPSRTGDRRRRRARTSSIGPAGSRHGSSKRCSRSCGPSATTLPVVLIVEDLHWADSSTRDVLSFLARNARTERLAVIGTYRTDELNRRHPLAAVAVRDGARAARRPHRDRPVRSSGARRADRTRSSAIAPSVDCSMRSSAEPRATRSSSRSCSRPAPTTPATACRPPCATCSMTRVTALSEDAQRILGVAAVGRADRRVRPAGRGRRLRRGRRSKVPLREALAAQILAIDPQSHPDAYRFRHALLAEAVYDDLLPSERRRLHAAYATALDAAARRGRRRGRQPARGTRPSRHRGARAGARAAGVGRTPRRAAAAAHAFTPRARRYERAIELWDAVPADDRPADTDAAALYHEGALAAMVSGRDDRAVRPRPRRRRSAGPGSAPGALGGGRTSVSRARMWISGRMDEGLARLEATATGWHPAERLADAGTRRSPRWPVPTCCAATTPKPSRRRPRRSKKRARPARGLRRGTRSTRSGTSIGVDRAMRGGSADPARSLRAGPSATTTSMTSDVASRT